MDYTKAQMEYISSVDGQAHQSAVEIIGRLEQRITELERQLAELQCVTEWQKAAIAERDKQLTEQDRELNKYIEFMFNADNDREGLERQLTAAKEKLRESVPWEVFSGECRHLWAGNSMGDLRCLDNHKEPCTSANCPLKEDE